MDSEKTENRGLATTYIFSNKYVNDIGKIEQEQRLKYTYDDNLYDRKIISDIEMNVGVLTNKTENSHVIELYTYQKTLYMQDFFEYGLYKKKNTEKMKDRDNNIIGFHSEEIIESAFLASLSEVVCLESKYEHYNFCSILLFLPKKIEQISKEQYNNLITFLNSKENISHIGLMLCESEFENNIVEEFDDVSNLIDYLQSFNLNKLEVEKRK